MVMRLCDQLWCKFLQLFSFYKKVCTSFELENQLVKTFLGKCLLRMSHTPFVFSILFDHQLIHLHRHFITSESNLNELFIGKGLILSLVTCQFPFIFSQSVLNDQISSFLYRIPLEIIKRNLPILQVLLSTHDLALLVSVRDFLSVLFQHPCPTYF